MSFGRRFYAGLILLFMTLIMGLALKLALAGQGHTLRQVRETLNSNQAVKASSTSPAPADSLFTSAAAQNSKLRYELDWSFGGKPQRGWYLYVPLIQRLIDCERAADSNEFAKALAGWQKSAGLSPTGILDNETLSQMVSTWQSRRIKERSCPPPDQLLTLSSSEFFDATRPDDLRKVERQTFAAYKRMLAAALADPSSGLPVTHNGAMTSSENFLKIISAFRSQEYQAQLRKLSPDAGRAGLAINSPHFTGRALDLYVGGEPVSTKDENRALQTQTRVYQWLVKNAGRFGFVPYFYEPWHWEYRPDLQ